VIIQEGLTFQSHDDAKYAGKTSAMLDIVSSAKKNTGAQFTKDM